MLKCLQVIASKTLQSPESDNVNLQKQLQQTKNFHKIVIYDEVH